MIKIASSMLKLGKAGSIVHAFVVPVQALATIPMMTVALPMMQNIRTIRRRRFRSRSRFYANRSKPQYMSSGLWHRP